MAYYDFSTGKWVYNDLPQPTITVAPPAPTQPLRVVSQPANLPTLTVQRPAPAPTGLSFFKYPDSQEVFDSNGHHYSSMAELTAAGGAGKIQTIPRPVTVAAPAPLPDLKVVDRPTPGAQPAGAKQLMPAQSPTSPEVEQTYRNNPTIQVIGPGKKSIPLDQVPEERANLAVDFVKALPGAFGKTATDFLRAPFRAGLSVMSSAFNKNDAEPIEAETAAQRFFIGKEPVVPIARRVADLGLKLQDKGFGKLSLPISSSAIIAGTTLDLLPTLGGGDSKAFKEAAGVLAEQLAKGVLKDEALNTVYKQFGTQVGKLVEQKALPKIENALLEAAPSVLNEAGQKIHIPIGTEAPKSDLADFVVGKAEDFNKISAKAGQLENRVAKQAINEPYVPLEFRTKPIPAGEDAILKRLRLEQNFGEIPREQVDAISKFIDNIGPNLVDDVGLSIRKAGGKQAQYEYGQSLVTLFRNNIVDSGGKFDRTIIHELWHSMSRYLPDADISAVAKQFSKERTQYVKKNPWFEAFLNDGKALTKEQGDKLIAESPQVKKYLEPIRDPDWHTQTGWKQQFDDANYRFKSLDEWFAESLTDKSIEHIKNMDTISQSIFAHGKDVVRKWIQGIQQLFGYDQTNRILKDFLNQKNSDLVRRGNLGGTLESSLKEKVLPSLEKSTKSEPAKLELPAVTKTDSLLTKLKNMLSPIKGADPAAQATYKEFVNSKLVGKELANQEARGLSEIPKKEGWSTILKYEKGEATPFTTKIQQVFDNLHNEATARGLEVPYLKNYVPQMYRNSPQEVTLAVAKYMRDQGVEANVVADYLAGKQLPEEIASKLKLNPSFTETRVLPDYKTAVEYGLTPKYTHPAQLAAAYRDSMESAIANKKLISDLVQQGRLSSTKAFGMKPVDISFSPEPLFAEPKLAQALNNITHDAANLTFGQAVLSKTAGVSKFMQELALSAGFPGTDVNFFSMGQLIKQLTTRTGEALLHPLTATVGVSKDLAAFARANLDSASIRFFEKKSPIIQKMAENGIDISERVGNFRDMYSNMVGSPEWSKLLGKGWDKVFQKKTFASFMPMNYVNTFEATYKSALKKGLSEEAASAIAADTTKAFHGLVDDVARSKNTQDALSAALFAPKFREGIINTLWNTGKSLTTKIANPAYTKNRQLAMGMLMTYGGYQYLNHKLSGQYTWQNEPGHEFDLRIPLPEGKGVLYVPFMPSFLSLPRNIGSAGIALYKGDIKGAYGKATSLLSMPIQISGQILNNQDYFGNPIYKDTDTRVEKLSKIGKYLGLQANHPYLKLVGNYLDNKKEPDKAFRKPLLQSLIEASEFPVKFETLDRISRAEFYAAVDKTTQANADAKRRLQPIYDKWQKLTDSGDVHAADDLISEKNMSEEDYKIFKSIRSGGVRGDTVDQEGKIYQSLYLPIQDLRKSGKDSEAQARINAMTDDEYHAYDLLRNRFGGL